MNETTIDILVGNQRILLPGTKYLPPVVAEAVAAVQAAIAAGIEAVAELDRYEEGIRNGHEYLRNTPQHIALRDALDGANRTADERCAAAQAVADEHAGEWAALAAKGYQAAAAKVGKLVDQLADALGDAHSWAAVQVMVANGAGRLSTQHRAWTADPRRFPMAELYAALGEHKLPAS